MKRKKLFATLAACALAGAMMIGGTFAYLTNTQTTTNTFTVGNVKVELTEPNYPGNDDPEVKDQVPNQETKKDPQITNTGSNEAVVFIKMTVPVRTITPVTDDGKKGTKGASEMFIYKQTEDAAGSHVNNFSKAWAELPAKEEGTDLKGATRTYVFGYKSVVAAKQTTDALFDKVQLKNFMEAEIASDDRLDIEIEAYAIQAQNIVNGEDKIDVSGELSVDTLNTIYDTFVNQNAEVKEVVQEK